MSLERKDVRAKLDPDMHRALQVLARIEGLTDGEWVEQVIVPVIMRRVHEASLIAAEARLAGITGNIRESSGDAGNGRESTLSEVERLRAGLPPGARR
jgi:hypothetical protein